MLSEAAQLDLTQNDLGTLNGKFKEDFKGTVHGALYGALSLPNGLAVEGLRASLAITYGCRNRGAHNVSTMPITADLYDRIVQATNDIIFLTIETLY